MANNRKLLAEIERVIKKVDEGVDTFNDIYDKIQTASNANQKDKYEGELKKEIKKLQRLRDSIKGWLTSNDIKDKKVLMEKRKLVETQMELFKVVERQTKTKAFSKEGLNQASKMDPKQKAKKRTQTWIQDFIDQLNMQVDTCDAQVETLVAGSKKKKDVQKQAKVDALHEKVGRHKFHVDMLERCLRSLENETVQPQEMDDIKEEVEYYVESHDDPDFQENEYLYEDFDLEADPDEANHLRETETKDDDDDPPPKEEKVPKKKDKEEKKKKKEKDKEKDADAEEKTKVKKSKEAKARDVPVDKDVVVPIPTKEESPALVPAGPPAVAETPAQVTPASAAPVAAPKYATAASLLRTQPSPVKPPQSVGHASPSFSALVDGVTAPASKQDSTSSASNTTNKPPPINNSQDAMSEKPMQHQQQPIGLKSPTRSSPLGVTSKPASGSINTAFLKPEDNVDDKEGTNVQMGGVRGVMSGARGGGPGAQATLAHGQHALGPPGIYDFTAGLGGAATAEMTSGMPTTPTGAQCPSSTLGGVGTGTDDAFAHEIAMLEASYRCKPEPGDSSKPNMYTVKNPFPVAQYYRDIPYVPLDTPQAFSKMEMDPLFFAFYYQQNSYQQFLAAKELKKKSWRFHKKYRTWFQRHEDPTTITDEYEQGTYVYFDNDTSWTMRKKAEFRFDYVHLQSDTS